MDFLSTSVTDEEAGALVGVYATTNGGDGRTPVYVSEWKYYGQGQFRD